MKAKDEQAFPRDIDALLRKERRIPESSTARRRRMMQRLDRELGLGVAIGMGGGLVAKTLPSLTMARVFEVRRARVLFKLVLGALSAKGKVLVAMLVFGSVAGLLAMHTKSMRGAPPAKAEKGASVTLSVAMSSFRLSTERPSKETSAAMPCVPTSTATPTVGEEGVEKSSSEVVRPKSARVSPLFEPPTTHPIVASTALPRVASDGALAASASDAELAQERRLLSSARAALDAGNATKALGFIESHVRQFPSGRLSEEREAIRIEALRVSGASAAAEAARREFAHRYPSSVLEDRVNADPRPNASEP